MVKLIVGKKGSGKTGRMINMANESAKSRNGSIIFINKDQRLMYDLVHDIRFVCIEEYEGIKSTDAYTGFIYGLLSSDHDLEVIFIDSILKHADISLEDLPDFLSKIDSISEKFGVDFIVSVSSTEEELPDTIRKYEILTVQSC